MSNNLIQPNTSEIINTLFPKVVTGIVLPIDDYQAHLHPDEFRVISSASVKRKLEFSTGRWCAKQILKSQGKIDVSILVGDSREPIWPTGFVGSISHCKDQCGAVIAKNSNIKSIGFDIENIKKLKNDIAKIVCTNNEKEWIKKQALYPYNVLVLLIFSLKESIYKCVYQHQRIKLGFKDFSITPDLNTNIAEIIVNKDNIDSDIQLSFSVSKTHIHSGATHF